jgi:ABC-type multidrug transport system fused ATPase/permease subunit
VIRIFQKLYSLLDARERRRVPVVFGLLLIVAIFGAFGVASIMPFIAVLAQPELVETNPYLSFLYTNLGFDEVQDFLIFLGIAFFAILIGSLVLQALGYWVQLRFSYNRNYSWGARLIRGYLRQPYEWFLNRHSADLATSVLSEVMQVVIGALFPAMQVIANVLIAALLLALLLAVDPLLAIAMGTIIGGSYLLIAAILKQRMQRVGRARHLATEARFRVVQEASSGIKEVKIAGLEDVFVSRFEGPARNLARSQISAGLIRELPLFAIQGLLFGGMLLALLYLMWRHGGLQESLPIVALYAFAGYRLMPAVQKVYGNISQARYSEAALDALCADMSELEKTNVVREAGAENNTAQRLRLEQELVLSNVEYAYPNADRVALNAISLVVPAGTTVGLVGSTGSGKTTTVDVILGLLRPTGGTLTVDNVDISDANVRQWQRSLGYVPQQIYLTDDTVAANVAFGLPRAGIDMPAVERAARVANLHDFVINELPDGYQTEIGERGVRLSGGQRQRIGIARALYHDPDILILDEATSALDNLTERSVMEALSNLGSRKTIILIAHRLSTVRNCDPIYLLEHGRVVGSGTYDELIVGNEHFRAMAEQG